MAKIVDIDPREMSFIKTEYKGEKWSPVNGDAVVLTVKGEKSGFVDKVKSAIDTLKALVGADGEPDADYTEKARSICYAAADIQRAMELEEPERSKAIVAAVDKAGARHRATDVEQINGIMCAVKDINVRLAALGFGDPVDEQPIADESNDNPLGDETPGDGDGDADDVAEVEVTDDRGTGQNKGEKEPYGDVEYADPGYQDDKKKRYPLDSEEHVRAAASYFGMQKNRDKYTAEQQKEISARIAAAEKKFGIGEKAEAEVVEETLNDRIKAQAEAIITAKAAEFQQQIESAKAESQSQIDALKAQSDSRVAELESQLQATTQRAQEAELAVKAMVGEARKPSSPGFVPTLREDGRRDDPAAEANKAETIERIGPPSKIADVIKLQRLVNQ